VIIPDINLLLYAHNPHAPQHPQAVAWWRAVMNGEELVGLPPEVIFGFLRIATHPRLGAAAVSFRAAERVVRPWLERPQVRVLQPPPDHVDRVLKLMIAVKGQGALMSDAVLAAYALGMRATLCSNDTDFARFPGLDWKNPLAA